MKNQIESENFRGWGWSRTTGTRLFRSLLYLNPEELLSYHNQVSYKDKNLFETTKLYKNFFFEFEYRVSFIAYKFQTLYKDRKLFYSVQKIFYSFSDFRSSEMTPVVFNNAYNFSCQILFIFIKSI